MAGSARPASVRSTSPISSASMRSPTSCRFAGRPMQRAAGKVPAACRHGPRANVCSPDLALDRVSAFLLQLSPGTRPDDVKFALPQLPDVKIVEGNTVLTSSRQALSTLLVGISVFTAVPAHRPADPGRAAVLVDRAGTLSRARPAAGDGREAHAGDDRHPHGGGDHHRPRRPRRSRLRRRRAAHRSPVRSASTSVCWACRSPGRRSRSCRPARSSRSCSPPLLGLVGALLPAWRVRRMAPYALIQSEGR